MSEMGLWILVEFGLQSAATWLDRFEGWDFDVR